MKSKVYRLLKTTIHLGLFDGDGWLITNKLITAIMVFWAVMREATIMVMVVLGKKW